MPRFRLLGLIILGLLLLSFMPVTLVRIVRADLGGPVPVPEWSSVSTQPYPMSSAPGAANPVMTAAKVGGGATYVFNPRLFHEGNTWYMFMAVQFAAGTKIGYATSGDGLTWTYQGILLDYTSEAKSISAPLVFKVDNEYFMMPSCQAWNELRLYKAASFPTGWTLNATLKTGIALVDPCIMRYADTWWIFAATGTARDSCVLYYNEGKPWDAASWTTHPSSPIVSGDASKARPAGRNIVFDNNKIIRWAMYNTVVFGQKVRAFQITTLTKTDYVEAEIAESPVLSNSGSGWNANGMHAVDPWWVGNKWLIAVDGQSATPNDWSIGIYATSPIAASMISCNGDGAETNTFDFRDSIYINASGLDISKTHTYNAYIVGDTDWSNGMDIPDAVVTTSVTANQYGKIQLANVWTEAQPGHYDIVVDVNGDGVYDEGLDALDNVGVNSTGFFVIPEYAIGTILAIGVCFAGVAVYKRSKNNKKKTV